MPDSKDLFDLEPEKGEKGESLEQAAAGPPPTPEPKTLPKKVAAKDKQLRADLRPVSFAEKRAARLEADRVDGTLARDRRRRIGKGPKPALLRDLAAADLEEKPTQEEVEHIAASTGIPIASLEGCATNGAIVARVLSWRARLGHIPSIQEIHDRLDPKTQKHEHGVTARPMAPHGENAAENAAAAAFFENLDCDELDE